MIDLTWMKGNRDLRISGKQVRLDYLCGKHYDAAVLLLESQAFVAVPSTIFCLNCGAVTFDSHGCNPWLVKQYLSGVATRRHSRVWREANNSQTYVWQVESHISVALL